MSKLLAKLKAEAQRTKSAAETREAQGGEFTKVNWFQPKKGDTSIRILPHWKKPKDELFFLQVRTHFGVTVKGKDGNEYQIPVRCLRDFEENCPLCDEYDSLDKEERKTKRDLRATERYLYNIFDYDAKEFKVYAAPTTVHEAVFGWVDDLGDVTDFAKGRDWKLTKKVDKSKGRMFGTSYDIKPKLTETAVPKKVLAELKEKITDLTTVYSENHREAMEVMLGLPTSTKKATKAKVSTELEDEEDVDMPKVDDGYAEVKEEVAKTAAVDAGDDDELARELKALGVD